MSLAVAVAPMTTLPAHLGPDRERVDSELARLVLPDGAKRTPFREAMEYATFGPGQRLRPVLALRIARVLGTESALTLRAGAAIELLHCASLIVDDLPCMDDDDRRRGRPSTHIVYGESTALLAAFGLVGLAGRSLLTIPFSPAQADAILSFQARLLGVLDLAGLCEGQDMDLRIQGEERALLRSRINELKTVPLFELAGYAGALPLSPDAPAAVKAVEFARSFGRAYQLVDDYLDGEMRNRSRAVQALRQTRAILEFRSRTGDLNELLDYLEKRIQIAQ